MSGLVSTMMGWGGDNLMSGLLMALMLGVISLFIWLTVRTIRRERANVPGDG